MYNAADEDSDADPAVEADVGLMTVPDKIFNVVVVVVVVVVGVGSPTVSVDAAWAVLTMNEPPQPKTQEVQIIALTIIDNHTDLKENDAFVVLTLWRELMRLVLMIR
jgi:hypothetical protein